MHFRHEAQSTAPAYTAQRLEDLTSPCRQAAPSKFYLDLRGSSFQPSQLPAQSNVDPSDTLTRLPSETSPGGRLYFSTSCTTAAGNLEQCGIPPMQHSFSMTTATVENLWQSADPASTYTNLQGTMATEAAAAAAAPATACSAHGGMTTHLECPFIITEDDSTLRTPEFHSQVRTFLLKFQVIVK